MVFFHSWWVFSPQNVLNNNNENMILVGHKLGCPVAIEMTLQLQRDDLDIVKQLVCLEGSHRVVSISESDCLSLEQIEGDAIEEIEQTATLTFLGLYKEIDDKVSSRTMTFDNMPENSHILSNFVFIPPQTVLSFWGGGGVYRNNPVPLSICLSAHISSEHIEESILMKEDIHGLKYFKGDN